MTLAQLAERCNISESSASRYLNGKVVPPADVAERILQELGTEIMATTAPEDKPHMVAPPVLQIWEVYQEEINTLQAYHKNHVEMLKANHADHVETMKANHAAQVADLKKDKKHLFITMLVLFALLVYFILDGLHGDWGIIRYYVG